MADIIFTPAFRLSERPGKTAHTHFKRKFLPLLIRLSETETIPPLGRKMLRNDMLASNLYTSVVTDKFKTAFQNEYKQKVIKI